MSAWVGGGRRAQRGRMHAKKDASRKASSFGAEVQHASVAAAVFPLEDHCTVDSDGAEPQFSEAGSERRRSSSCSKTAVLFGD